MTGHINSISSVRQLQLQHEVQGVKNPKFEHLMREQLNQKSRIQFSKHATERVAQRGIEVTDSFLDGLNEAVGKARDKGAKDVVVIADNGAFLVNIPNNVVITTVSKNEMKENIFTNIDSAVIM